MVPERSTPEQAKTFRASQCSADIFWTCRSLILEFLYDRLDRDEQAPKHVRKRPKRDGKAIVARHLREPELSGTKDSREHLHPNNDCHKSPANAEACPQSLSEQIWQRSHPFFSGPAPPSLEPPTCALACHSLPSQICAETGRRHSSRGASASGSSASLCKVGERGDTPSGASCPSIEA